MQTIRLLYADTGGGHRTAAEAVQQGLNAVYPGRFKTSLHNIFRQMSFPFTIAEQIYPPTIKFARPLYAKWYRATNNPSSVDALSAYFRWTSKSDMAQFIAANPADLYLSFHPMYNSLVPQVLRDMQYAASFINVVTDMISGHGLHYSKDVHHCIVPTEATRLEAIKFGMPAHKISVGGQPVWADFQSRLTNTAAVRQQLQLDSTLPIVLLMGGGDGMGKMVDVAKALAQSNLPIQLVVVCGRNYAAQAVLKALNSNMPICVLGFVKTIPELMGLAYMLVTKAGPGTICEGFIAGLPIIIYDAVPGQEDANVTYVVENGAGAWAETPHDAVVKIANLLASPQAYHYAQTAAFGLAKPNAAKDIAKIAVRVMENPSMQEMPKTKLAFGAKPNLLFSIQAISKRLQASLNP